MARQQVRLSAAQRGWLKILQPSFSGATIVDAAITALERGVTGMPKLTDATDVLISGDSAGASGARAHLDRIAARLRAGGQPECARQRTVRGHFQSLF